jgi:hypothetical protein
MEVFSMKKESFLADPVLQQRLAKYIVEQCFRNSQLEDLHAGTAPDSETGDYSDVVVKTPFGEIPWRNLSRFDDAEMKVLMRDVVNLTYRFIHKLFDEEQGAELLLRLAARDLVPQWDNPTLPTPSTSKGREREAALDDLVGGAPKE